MEGCSCSRAVDYNADARRVWRNVWRLAGAGSWARGGDMGVGDSTRWLLGFQVEVVGVDRDPRVLAAVGGPGFHPVNAVFHALPLRERSLDSIAFCFSLHETSPPLHTAALTEAGRAAASVVIVEPSPRGCPLYERYAETWREAVHSVGGFEDYQPLSYWVHVAEKAGLQVVATGVVEWEACVPPELLRSIAREAARQWRLMGVDERYVETLAEIARLAEVEGFKWSPIQVVVARPRHGQP